MYLHSNLRVDKKNLLQALRQNQHFKNKQKSNFILQKESIIFLKTQYLIYIVYTYILTLPATSFALYKNYIIFARYCNFFFNTTLLLLYKHLNVLKGIMYRGFQESIRQYGRRQLVPRFTLATLQKCCTHQACTLIDVAQIQAHMNFPPRSATWM